MVLFVGAHRPDRKPVFRLFRVSGRSAGRVCRTTGDSESRFAAFPGSGSDSGFCSGFGRGCGEELLFRTSSAPDAPGPPSGAVRDPAAGCFGCSLWASAAHLLFRMPSGHRAGQAAGASTCLGGVSGCRRCPRSGGAACASGACRRSSAPPLRARSPGRARAWRSTTARRRSP